MLERDDNVTASRLKFYICYTYKIILDLRPYLVSFKIICHRFNMSE